MGCMSVYDPVNFDTVLYDVTNQYNDSSWRLYDPVVTLIGITEETSAGRYDRIG